MSRSTIAVVVPAFNRCDLLRLALDSVARQTWRDFETIVVDDGSTQDIAAAIEGHPARPRLVRQSNSGPGGARNRGVSATSADVIAFLDSDDEWLPTKLERFLACMEARPDVPIWYGPMQPIDSEGRLVAGRTKDCVGGRITAALFQSSFVHVPTVVMRREVFDAFGGFNPSLPVCEDYDLWLRISTRHEFGLVPDPLALRRLHSQRLSKSSMRRNLVVKARVLEQFMHSADARGLLDMELAQSRLARVLHASARAAFRDRRIRLAREMIARAREYGATLPRVGLLSLAAEVALLLGLDRFDDGPPTTLDEAWADDRLPLSQRR